MLVLASAVLFVACSAEQQTDYTVENRDAFLAACTDRETDTLLQQRVCQCVFDEAVQEIPFQRFDEIATVLGEDSAAPLPDELIALVARCVTEEADL